MLKPYCSTVSLGKGTTWCERSCWSAVYDMVGECFESLKFGSVVDNLVPE